MADVINLEVQGEPVHHGPVYTGSALPNLIFVAENGSPKTYLSERGEFLTDMDEPNAETAAAYRESFDLEHLTSFDSIEDLWTSLNDD